MKGEKKRMVAIMKYESGLKFTGYICENREVAERFVKDDLGWVNERAYEIMPVKYVTEQIVWKVKEGD